MSVFSMILQNSNTDKYRTETQNIFFAQRSSDSGSVEVKFEVTTCDREKWQHELHLIGLPKLKKGRSAAGELNTFHFYNRNII